MAQTAAPAPSTAVVYSQPSAADTYIAAHPGAAFFKADSNGLTFQTSNGHYTFFTAPGIVHQQNGQWLPAQLQVAQASDGSGWQLQGTAMNVAFTGATKDKDMVVSSGAVTFSLHLPSFSYNGDDTFAFQENGTAWLLRVSRNSVDIEAAVATHIGKKTHSLTYNAGSATVTIDQNGSLNVGDAALVSRAVVRGADGKLYGICSPWSTSGSAVSFTCDDTALPSTAFPYVIDPSTTTWSFNSSFFSMPSSPVEYVGTGSARYFSWTATANLSTVAPQGAIITSSTINASGLGGSTAWDSRWGPPGSPYTSSCNVYGTGTDNSSQAWVTALTYWSSGATAGCILSVSGQSSLSGTVTWWQASVTAPSTPSGPASGAAGASYTYSTGGATTTSGDTPQYMFNWGDGSNSGWLAPGTASASHIWASPGTYQVSASAEDASYGTTSGSGAKTVTITPSPPTLTSVSPSSGVQNSSVPVTLTGTNFVSGATVSTTNSGIAVSGVTVVSSTRITATFSIGANAAVGAANVTVTTSGGTSGAVAFTVYQAPLTSVSTFPVGLQVTVDGVAATCSPYCNYYWVPGTSHTIAASTQPGTTGTQWLWASWSDAGAASHGITASTSGASYTASFNPQYYFTSSVSPSGTGTVAPGSGWYNAGASFWATATPNTGYQLSSFSPGGAVPSYDVVMNGPVTLIANFVAFTGQTITSNPPGAVLTVDGNSCTAPCTFYWTTGAQHTIATTSPQSLGSGSQLVFASWSDGSTGSSDTITAAAGTTYTANFNAQYYLTTAVSPSGDGTVNLGSGWYNAGAQVTLTASASSGYQFTNFTGTANGGSPLSITMNAPASETANFAANGGFTITATPSDQTVAAGGSAAYTVTPTATFGFSGQIALSGSCDSDVVPVFSPATIPATGSSTVTLTSSSSDSFDLTNCTITGTSGSNLGRVPIILRLYVSVRIAIAPTGVGLIATSDGGPPNGITQVAPIQVLWKVGSTHTISVASPQAGTDGNEYAFSTWSDGGAISHAVTASHAVTRYSAAFVEGVVPITGGPVPESPPSEPPAPLTSYQFQGSVQNCNDISGTWSDPNWASPSPGAWVLSQSGETVTGTLSLSASCNSTLQYSVGGSISSSGGGALSTTSGPSFSSVTCGDVTYLEPASISVNVQVSCQTVAPSGYTVTEPPLGTGEAAEPKLAQAPPAGSWTGRTTPPGIDLTVDLWNDQVSTIVLGQNKTGSLSVSIADSLGNTTNLANHTSVTPGSGFPIDSLKRTSLAVGQYGNVSATWDNTSLTVPVAFYENGLTRFSQYNTPYSQDSSCGANQQTAYIFVAMDAKYCYYTNDTTLGAVFMSQVYTNGTGVIGSNQVIKSYNAGASNICVQLPPGATTHNAFFAIDTGGKPIPTIQGAGNSVLSDGTGTPSPLNHGNQPAGSVAALPAGLVPAPPFVFGDQILLVDQNDIDDSIGARSVQDLCPGCGAGSYGTQWGNTVAHIDTYNGSRQSCGVGTDYGNRYAIRLR